MAAKFNNIDDDFACPYTCSVETLLTGPRTCVKKMQAHTCVHPVSKDLSALERDLGMLTASQSLRAFSGVFQQPVILAKDEENGNTYLCLKDDDGNLMPITEALNRVCGDDMQGMREQLEQIRTLDETNPSAPIL